MLLRVLFLTLLPAAIWAEPFIQSASPINLPAGIESEIRFKSSDGIDNQFVIMPGGPYIKEVLPLSHPIHDMVAYQGHGLLAAGEKGLLIANVATSGKIDVSAAYAAQASVTRVITEREHAWLIDGGTEIVELGISNVEQPEVLGRYRIGQAIADIAAQDDFVYLLLGKTTVAVIDMRKPQVPVELSRFALDAETKRIFVADDHLYVAQPGNGLVIFDVADKSYPRQIGRHAVNGGATSVIVQHDVALVARGEGGITLFDVSDPAHAKWLGSHSSVGHVAGVAMQSNKTLLWNDRAELISFDIDIPELPAIASLLRNVNANAAIWLDDKTVLASSESGLESIDFSAQPPLFSNANLDVGQGVNFGGERRLFIEGNIAYVADWFSGLHLYDISVPSRPHLISSFHTPGSAKGVVVRGGYAYIADDDHGLHVVDVSDPFHPVLVSSLATEGLAYTPKLAGNLLYLAGHRGGFQIVDVSEASAPRLLASVGTPGKAWGLEVKGKTLFVADDDAGLLVFDVNDVKHPRQIGTFNPGGAAEDIVVRGNTAYVAFFDGNIYVLDISNPARPRQVGHTSTPGNARVIALKGDLAYVTDWFAGIQVIDVSEKTNPVIVGEYDTNGAAWGIGIKGDHAFIGDWWGGFAVLNISDPKNPSQVDRYQSRGKVVQIASQGKFAYAAMEEGGVHVFDITNPLNPTWSNAIEVDGNITGLCVQGALLYVAIGSGTDSGLVIIDINNPFQARRIKHLAMENGVQHIRNGTNGLYIGNEQGLGVIAPQDPLRVQTWMSLAKTIKDLWIEGERVYLATEQGMELLDEQLDPKIYYRTEHPSSMVRVRGSDVFLYGAELGVQVLAMSDDEVRSVSTFDPIALWSDMIVESDVLYATETAGNLLVLDIADPSRIGIRGLYPLSGPATGIEIINGVALLAGNDIITSVKLFLPVKITQRDKKEIRMMLPKDLPAGNYDVVEVAPNGSRTISHNYFSIDTAKYFKPEITAEEFQLLLQEQQNKSAPSERSR